MSDHGGALITAGSGPVTSAQGGRNGSAGNKGAGADATGGDADVAGAGKSGGTGAGGTPSSPSGGTASAETGGKSAFGGSAPMAGSGAGGAVTPPSGIDLLDDMEMPVVRRPVSDRMRPPMQVLRKDVYAELARRRRRAQIAARHELDKARTA